MRRHIRICLIILLGLFNFALCSCQGHIEAKKQEPLESINRISGNIYNDLTFEQFNKKAELHFTIEKNSVITAVLLFEAHKVVQFNIPITDVESILYVKLVEKKNLNIDRYLLETDEYYWCPESSQSCEKKVLSIHFDIPYIYILHGDVNFDLEIGAISNSMPIQLKRKIIFYWKPMEKSSDARYSFRYLESLINDVSKVDVNIREKLRDESRNTNLKRFSDTYRNDVLMVIDK